jgi:hypothetical protein
LKEEALDRTIWRTRFWSDYVPVVRPTTEWMNEWSTAYLENLLMKRLGQLIHLLPSISRKYPQQ